MQETTEQLSASPAVDDLVASARTAGDWAGEPLLHSDEDPPGARARNGPPERARRGARRDRSRQQGAVLAVEGALRAHARPRARPVREASAPRVGHRAAPPPGGRARRDAHGADRRQPASGRGAAERQRERERPHRAGDAEEEDADFGVIDEDRCPRSCRRPRTPAPSAATASGTRPRPARRSPPPGSSRRPGRWAS